MPDNYPDILPNSASWTSVSNTQMFTSPFNKSTQTIGLTGSLWSAQLNYPALVKAKYNILNPFLIGLRGMAGRFYLSPPQYIVDPPLPSGITATASGVNLTLDTGVTALDVGAYISINHELKIIISKTSDTVFTVNQPFLQAYASQSIELNNPDCLMMLSEDTLQMDFTSCLFQSFTINCIEAISV